MFWCERETWFASNEMYLFHKKHCLMYNTVCTVYISVTVLYIISLSFLFLVWGSNSNWVNAPSRKHSVQFGSDYYRILENEVESFGRFPGEFKGISWFLDYNLRMSLNEAQKFLRNWWIFRKSDHKYVCAHTIQFSYTNQ